MRVDEFRGKRAVVTGAASGIGRAVAQMVAEGGADLLCLDVDDVGLDETAQLIRKRSPNREVSTAPSDVADRTEVLSAFEEAGFDTVDLLFNVAGVIMAKPLVTCDVDDLTRLMRVNVGSIIAMVSVAVPLMPPGGVIINTASGSVHHYSNGLAIYGASKAAVVHITKCLANELSSQEIRVCAVGPGGVDTPMPRRLLGELGLDPEPAIRAAAKRSQLIPDLATAEEIAAAMLYLASRDGRFCTGSTFWIDGGASVR